jgi:hypothetical protein
MYYDRRTCLNTSLRMRFSKYAQTEGLFGTACLLHARLCSHIGESAKIIWCGQAHCNGGGMESILFRCRMFWVQCPHSLKLNSSSNTRVCVPTQNTDGIIQHRRSDVHLVQNMAIRMETQEKKGKINTHTVWTQTGNLHISLGCIFLSSSTKVCRVVA